MNRDILGGDDKEPVRPQADHIHFITRGEFQNLHDDVKDSNKKLDDVVGKVNKICTHIENQEKAKQEVYKKVGIFGGFISAIIGVIIAVINRAW